MEKRILGNIKISEIEDKDRVDTPFGSAIVIRRNYAYGLNLVLLDKPLSVKIFPNNDDTRKPEVIKIETVSVSILSCTPIRSRKLLCNEN